MNALAFLLALAAAGADATDDPMIRWDCDPAGKRLVLEMVRPPLAHVTERELLLLSGDRNFQQCRVNGANWSLLVDLIEYDAGRCEPFPDTIVSLLRDGKLVLSRVHVGRNCGRLPVLSAARIDENGETRIDLCAAETYGGESRCAPFRLDDLQRAVDNEGVAAQASERP
jgi:hypothetical protein